MSSTTPRWSWRDLRAADAGAALDELIAGVVRALEHIELPTPLSRDAPNADIAERMLEIVRKRLEGF